MRTVAHLLVFLTAAAMGKRLSFAGTAWDKHKQEVANVRNTLSGHACRVCAGARAECPSGWLAPPDASLKFCYEFQLKKAGFVYARAQCKAVGGDLVSFTTQAEAVRAGLMIRCASEA